MNFVCAYVRCGMARHLMCDVCSVVILSFSLIHPCISGTIYIYRTLTHINYRHEARHSTKFINLFAVFAVECRALAEPGDDDDNDRKWVTKLMVFCWVMKRNMDGMFGVMDNFQLANACYDDDDVGSGQKIQTRKRDISGIGHKAEIIIHYVVDIRDWVSMRIQTFRKPI